MEKIAEGIWRIRFGQPEKFTPAAMRTKEIMFEEIAKLPAVDCSPFQESDFSFKITRRGCVIEHPICDEEQIYGFGLQLKSFNQRVRSHNTRGLKKHLRVNSDPIADSGDSHAPVPFYVSTAGYGIFIDTARYATCNCGTHKRLDPEKEVTGVNMAIQVPSVQGVDIYIFAGPNMKDAVQRYNLFAGGGFIPPYWGLGVMYRTYHRADTEIVKLQVGQIRGSDIPCDVYGFEGAWHKHCYSCSYTWNDSFFEDPDKLLEELKIDGFEISLWEHIFVHPTAPFYDQLKKYSGDHEVWEGLVPDLSIPEARKIFADYHKKAFVDKGVLSFKLDECDNSDYNATCWSFPEYTEFPSGMDGEQMHCLLGILYQQTLLSIFTENNMRTYGQARSSHALATPLPFVLYSDLYDHRDFIRGVVNMGFSGLQWVPEVRNCESVEDLLRRIEAVVFSPQALINAFPVKNLIWLQYDFEKNMRDEFLENYKEVEAMCRKFLKLRMRFIPYLYSSYARYRFEGLPPFRALVMDYPDDENTFEIDDEYMMGDSVLVAPAISGQSHRKIYLPKGDNWYCFWTHKKYEGGQTLELDVGLDEIPVFVKENTLLPLAEPINYSTPETCYKITVYGFGEKCDDFVLFEDDGYNMDYEKGKFNLLRLKWDLQNGHRVEKEGSYTGCKYEIIGWEQAGR